MIYAALYISLLSIGSTFILLAALGILRMPDLFMRLQVTSKASVLGVTCVLLTTMLHFSDTVVTVRGLVIIGFLVLTIPVATHMLARAGYATDVPLSDETVVNELAGRYDPQTHTLEGGKPMTWEIKIHPDAVVVGKRVAELGLPTDMLILLIHRGEEVVVPRGHTTLEANDMLQVFARPERMDAARQILESAKPQSMADVDVDRY